MIINANMQVISDTPRNLIENQGLGNNEIKNVLLDKNVDDLPVFIYTTKDEYMKIVVFDLLRRDTRATVLVGLNDEDLTSVTDYIDNKNKHRIVWGLSNPDETKNITVNDKSVESEELKYNYNGKEVVLDFWYVILPEKTSCTVKNPSWDYVIENNTIISLAMYSSQ
ncbi:MAG: hypothetical protein EOM05_00355 [Clostridia bacterium]|nr:hypothetical protein [Clostridia bacterium]